MISPLRPLAVPALRTGPGPREAAAHGAAADEKRRPVEPVRFKGDAPFFAQLAAQPESATIPAERAASAYRLQGAVDAPVRRLLSA